MKTVVAVSIDTALASQLQKKTKGTRSRIVERALRAYLKGETDYSIQDVETKILATVLMTRLQQENDWNHTPLSLMLMELRESL
tara:strand:- start:18 stop:269 length:252 start_codon:yes stop_codon:yes gene_type:complete